MSEQEKLNNNNKKLIESAQDTNDNKKAALVKPLEKEINGPKGLEPTRYGDWESKGRCYDF